jgi:hypothetical protein
MRPIRIETLFLARIVALTVTPAAPDDRFPQRPRAGLLAGRKWLRTRPMPRRKGDKHGRKYRRQDPSAHAAP